MTYPNVDFVYLNEEDMIKAGVTDMPVCIDAMEEVLKCMSKGDFVMGGENHCSHGTLLSFPTSSPFENMPLEVGEDRRFMAMPAYIGGPFDLCGMKWYGSNMENKKLGLPRSILMLMLNDKMTGAPLALMSANLVSAYRTGAIPGVGIRYLAKKNAKVCGVYGPGVMGKTGLEAILAERKDINIVKIKGRSLNSIEKFVDFIKSKYSQIKEIIVVDSLKELVEDSDIVYFAATAGHDTSEYPLVKKEWVKKGAMLVGTSAFDVEEEFLVKECKKVADSVGLYEAWASEHSYPTFGKIDIIGSKFTDLVHEGLMKMSDIYDMGKIITGEQIGRKDEDEVIVYSVGGMPVEDVAWGKICLDKAREKGIGTSLNLWKIPTLA